MSEQESNIISTKIDLVSWREVKRANSAIYLKRQASEVILFAIALSPDLQPFFLLKGGTLMGIANGSPRQTTDIDFTATYQPTPESVETICASLDLYMKRAAGALGFDRLVLAVQKRRARPRPTSLTMGSFPAIELNIGYAQRDSRHHERLLVRESPTTVQVQISFNEPKSRIQILELGEGVKLLAYSWIEQIAEKIRALLQQASSAKPNRVPKTRRQDIYDIDRLITNIDCGMNQDTELVLATRQKCHARGVYPTSTSFENPKLKELSRREWHTLQIELDEVPKFDDCYDRVAAFYGSLPWPE